MSSSSSQKTELWFSKRTTPQQLQAQARLDSESKPLTPIAPKRKQSLEPSSALPSNVSSFVLKVMKEALLIVNQETIVFINSSFEELCDYSSNEVLNDLGLLFPPDELFGFFDLVKKHLFGSLILPEAMVEIRNKRSGPFLSKVAFHPFLDEADNTRKCVCMFSDPLFYSPIFYTSTLMGLLEFCKEESECILLRANSAAINFFNLPAAGPTEQFPRKWTHRELGFQFDDDDLAFFSDCRSTDSPYIHIFNILRAENKPLWLAATVTYVGRSLRDRSLFIIKAEDITNAKRLELEVKDSKQSMETQRAFFAKIVHELRSPLAGLLGMADLLRHTRLTSEQEGFITTTEACGESILLLLGNLLDVANLEHKMVTLANTQFDVIQCVEEALDIMSVSAMQKGIELLYVVDDIKQPAIFNGDPLRLRQILLNLLSNAIKFTEAKESSVIVHVHHYMTIESGTVTLSFSVEDSGIGIPPEALTCIFEPFTQACPGINQKFGGSGLGLAVVQSLVNLMGGNIFVEQKSSDSIGSIFHFTVVLQPSDRESTLLELLIEGKKALVVLENAALAMNLQGRLKDLGISIVSTIEERPDFVCCDSLTSDFGSIPLIRVGALRPDGVTGEFLRKPIRLKDLVGALHRVLNLDMKPSVMQRLKRPPPPPICYFRVLLVDDNVLNRKVVQHLLEVVGCAPSAIYSASNGRDALVSLQQQMVDIVLMDLEMPVMGGLEAVREIRKQWPRLLSHLLETFLRAAETTALMLG